MNQKRDEIEHFLEKDLLPQVKEAFLKYKPADKLEIKTDTLSASVFKNSSNSPLLFP
jgi:hypothetical protein